MPKNTLTGLDKKKLQRWLLLFFFALAIPAAILIQQSYSRLKWETFHQHQLMADELSSRIDAEFLRLINIEEQRSFTDYSFLNITGNITNKASLLQRSPLSQFPLESEIAGLIGYFQVDSEGQLITPLLPGLLSEPNKLENNAKLYGIAGKEFAERVLLQDKIHSILSKNSLVKNTVSTPVLPQKVDRKKLKFDEKNKVKSESFFGGTIGSGLSRSMKQDASIASEDMVSSSSYDAHNANDVNNNNVILEEKIKKPSAQRGFDQLKNIVPKLKQKENNLGRLEDLKLKKTYSKEIQLQTKRAPVAKKKTASVSKFSSRSRKEQNRLPESELSMGLEQDSLSNLLDKDKSDLALNNNEGKRTKSAASIVAPSAVSAPTKQSALKIRTFESSIDPFEFSQLDSGHFVLFRNVWLNNKRTIQGLLIDQKPFLDSIINQAFRKTSLSQMSDLLVSHQGNVLSVYSANESNTYLKKNTLNGELLRQIRLSDPFGELQLLFSIQELPVGAGGKIILWLSFLLASVLCAGLYLMYRLGLAQINLANQQQDFVSAVSHELKTPLTSIRMYSEMLREGWVNDEKKKTYYDFIFDESERLSRLINNVLHLARVTRNKQTAELKLIGVPELIDGVRSKVSTQIKHAGFEFNLLCKEDAKDVDLEVDPDWFIQIMINLVDNAIKFSVNAEQQKIDLSCELQKNNIKFIIRDYGPGVDKNQMKKIFDLFYRTESELTRETVGTGIGLALVHQMMVNMGGKIDVVNREPGAEFWVIFPSR